MSLQADASDRMDRVKRRIILGRPWYATLMLRLRFLPTEEISTMATDGTSLLYSPRFVMSVSAPEAEAVVLHELAHVALLHCFRRGCRDPRRWNIACDRAANALLAADHIILPTGCVPPGPLDRTAEELYDDAPTSDDVRLDVLDPGDGTPDAPGPARMSERDWRDALAASRGLAPEHIQRRIDEMLATRVDWREVLARFISQTTRADTHTWTRANRRYHPAPGWRREPQIDLAVCVDTSGSISAEQYRMFTTEFRAIRAIQGVSAYLISADAEVHEVIEPGEDLPESLSGAGGTDFRPALARALGLDVRGIVYLTDGQGEFPAACQTDVLWVFTRNGADAPFGEKMYLEE